MILNNSLESIKNEIDKKVKIIVVSKTFPSSKIAPLIDYGHIHYGENKVQESLEKWTDLKKRDDQIKLHMIGKLQTNKVKFAVDIFDYIHSVDNLKLAKKISDEIKKRNKKIKVFIQVNIGDEIQKSGVQIDDLNSFFEECKQFENLDIIGLMCLPPMNDDSDMYFQKMNTLSKQLNLPELSMGMSQDYLSAASNNASFVRIGTKIFGERN